MEVNRCFGCMQEKQEHPVCEHCGWDERQDNLPHQLPVGTILQGHYLVGRVLGQGGFGITYLGWDLYLDIPVAIKEYYPGSCVTRDASVSARVSCYTDPETGSYETNKERFLREGRTLAKFKDLQNIVQIYGLFPENNTVYLVMEYARGRTLQQTLKEEGTMPLSRILRLLKPIMEDLQKVHEAGTIHRDISPDNIMLLEDGGAKLLDFGAVRQVEAPDQEGELSKSTEAILKQGFAPIEQYNSRGSLGPWTDVYALCATVCYCLSGKVPQIAPERTYAEEPDRFIDVLPITEKQKKVLRHGMAVKPRDRTASVAELLRQLESTLEKKEKKTEPIRPPVPEKTAVTARRTDRAPDKSAGKAPEKPPRPPKKRSPWPLVLGVGILAVAGFLLLKPQRDPGPMAGTPGELTGETERQETVAATAAVPRETEASVQESEAPTVPRETALPVAPEPMDVPFDQDLVLKKPEAIDEEEMYFFGTEVPRDKVTSISFRNTLEGAPENALDVSQTGNGGVLLWAEPEGELYHVVIAGRGKIFFPEDASYLLGGSNSCSQLQSIEFGGCVDTSRVTDMRGLFSDCVSLKQLDLRSFRTEQVTDMSYMLYGCTALEAADLSSFDTGSIVDMDQMFADCVNLSSLDLSGFHSPSIASMYRTFRNCHSLTELDLSGLGAERLGSVNEAFCGCWNLRRLDLSGFRSDELQMHRGEEAKPEHLFDGCREDLVLITANLYLQEELGRAVPVREIGAPDGALGEEFSVEILNSRSGSITVGDLQLQDTYPVDPLDSEEHVRQYFVGVRVYTPESAYDICTDYYGKEPGALRKIPLSQMDQDIWMRQGSSGLHIGSPEMRGDSRSITWSFSIPEEYPFDFNRVTGYWFAFLDELKHTVYYRMYAVTP